MRGIGKGRAGGRGGPPFAESAGPFPAAGSQGHFVRFYGDDAEMADAVAAYLAAGLSTGEGALLIASTGHLQAVLAALSGLGFDTRPLLERGQLSLQEARELLIRVAAGGITDEDRFMRVIGGMIVKAAVGRPALRVFDGAGLLPWCEGDAATAIALENLWTKLGRTVSFSLLCAYPLRGFRGPGGKEGFTRICGAHDAVIPAEPFHAEAPEAERLLQVAALQRRVAELEARLEDAHRQGEERREADERLRQARNLETVGRLAGGVAHDFNNLLTAINGYSEIGLTLAPEEGPLREFLGEIRRAGERAAALTQQLLAYGRRQILSPVLFDLNGTAQDMERMLRRVLGGDIRIEMALQPGLGRIQADPGQVQQVLLNLALNARDAMPAGGAFALATADVLPEAGPDRPARPYVRLSVGDTGSGMAPEVRERVFEPFFTTKEAGAGGEGRLGSGLGLSSVYGVVRQSGGFIEVESQPGRGSTFHVHFPWAEAEGGEAPLLPDAAAPAILVVAADPLVRSFLARSVAAAGCVPAQAEDGPGALARAQALGRLDALLVADPEADLPPAELASRLRVRHPALRILAVAGSAESMAPQSASGAREVRSLRKPLAREALVRALRETLAGPVSD